jgi:hypothetical protein
LIDEDGGVRAGCDLRGDLGQCRFIASVSQRGMTRAAPLPCFGQIAPKIQAEAVRWSLATLGRVPRLARRRLILFFWPISALIPSSWRDVGEPDLSGPGIYALLASDLFQA